MDLFPEIRSFDILDIYSKRVWLRSKSGKRLTPTHLYKYDPCLQNHYAFARQMIERLSAQK